VDILNLDAYGYLENLALYPADLRKFIDRGGMIAWGIVPSNEEVDTVSPYNLAEKLNTGITKICEKATARGMAIQPEEFNASSLITPACGLGPTTPEIADKVLAILMETGKLLR
jgi:hypothetical protein